MTEQDEKKLWELELSVAKGKKRIRDLYNQTGGACYLSFSGGKDSTVVLALIKLCEEDGDIPKNAIPAVFCNTKIEMDATLDFVNWVKDNYYSNVQIIETTKSFGQVIKEYGKPLRSKMKAASISRIQKAVKNGKDKTKLKTWDYMIGQNYCNCKKIYIANKDLHFIHEDFDIPVSQECCHQMKKIPFKIYADDHNIEGFFTGERMAEGGSRQMVFEKKLASGQSVCTRIKGPYTVKTPIVDWSDEILEYFIQEYNVPLSRAYTEYGCKRTGCFLCPFSQELYSDLKVLYAKEPKKYKASLAFLKDVYIAQGVKLDFDPEYMNEFNNTWPKYEAMRYEMLKKYRPDCRLAKKYEKDHEDEQLSFDLD